MVCKNCNTEFTDDKDFCSGCGAKVIRNRLTLKALFSHFSEQFLNYDNKFLQTFIYLFIKPEKVIGSYINGTRKKYVNVISYFAIAITLSGLYIFILNKFFPNSLDISVVTAEGQENFSSNLMKVVLEYQSIVMMLYIPIFALMSKIVFFNIKKYNYTEHLTIFMYIQAQISIVLAIVGVVNGFFGITIGAMSVLTILLMILYSAYCLKRLYKLSIKGIFLRTLLFLGVLVVFYIIFTILFIGVMTYQYGGFAEFMEAQKAISGN